MNPENRLNRSKLFLDHYQFNKLRSQDFISYIIHLLFLLFFFFGNVAVLYVSEIAVLNTMEKG